MGAPRPPRPQAPPWRPRQSRRGSGRALEKQSRTFQAPPPPPIRRCRTRQRAPLRHDRVARLKVARAPQRGVPRPRAARPKHPAGGAAGAARGAGAAPAGRGARRMKKTRVAPLYGSRRGLEGRLLSVRGGYEFSLEFPHPCPYDDACYDRAERCLLAHRHLHRRAGGRRSRPWRGRWAYRAWS